MYAAGYAAARRKNPAFRPSATSVPAAEPPSNLATRIRSRSDRPGLPSDFGRRRGESRERGWAVRMGWGSRV